MYLHQIKEAVIDLSWTETEARKIMEKSEEKVSNFNSNFQPKV
jgi:hypothetical protein